MKYIKTYGSLLLSYVAVFTLGGYTYGATRGLETIEPHRWVITTLFGLMFLGLFLINKSEEK